jgi:hypothetical protein
MVPFTISIGKAHPMFVRSRIRLPLLLTTLILCSCDPQQEALKVFTQQGLTLLKPARNYIALGGIFVVPKSGIPVYLDPYDSIPPSGGTATKFNAVVMQQSSNRSIGLDAAVGTLGGLVPIPAGLKFSHTAQVQLDQIDTSGTRYTSQMIAALIQMPGTSGAIQNHFQPGNRVFVVQELYTGTSLSLKASSGTGLGAAVEGGATIPTCDSGGQSAAKAQDNAGGKDGKSGATSGSTSSGKSSANTNSDSTQAGSEADKSSGSKGSSNSPDASKVGISVGICWANAATLSFKSESPIPFAVRLNEVILGAGNALTVKDTNFKLPNTALGAEDVSATALINKDDPTLNELVHQSH